MFESVTPDPGQDALRRAGRMFRVVAILIAAGTMLLSVPAVSGGRSFSFLLFGFNMALALIAWVTAGGIEEQKSWALWVGVLFALLELFNIPFGTIIGIAILVYLVRASKAGLFARSAA